LAKYKKKRVRELQHDRFRDTAMTLMDRLGDRLEGKGKTILYSLGAVILLIALAGLYMRWSNKKEDEALRALGRGITIATAPISPAASTDPTNPTFTNERERAQRATEEFQKVVAKYGDPYRTEARYFAATNQLLFNREQGISELTELSRSGNTEVASLARFALAQAKEADGGLDEAAELYRELAAQNSVIITSDTANLRLALVYDKQGKKQEAADLLFNIVEGARKAKDADGTPKPESAAVREAAKELQRIDPARHSQLSPVSPLSDLAF